MLRPDKLIKLIIIFALSFLQGSVLLDSERVGGEPAYSKLDHENCSS